MTKGGSFSAAFDAVRRMLTAPQFEQFLTRLNGELRAARDTWKLEVIDDAHQPILQAVPAKLTNMLVAHLSRHAPSVE